MAVGYLFDGEVFDSQIFDVLDYKWCLFDREIFDPVIFDICPAILGGYIETRKPRRIPQPIEPWRPREDEEALFLCEVI